MDGRKYAVIIGVNRCSRDESVPVLRFAEEDAKGIFALLTEPTTGTFDAADCSLLLGSDATAAAVITTLRRLVWDSGPHDVLLVFFAGHGIVSEREPAEAYLATSDFSSEDIRLRPQQAIRMRSLRQDIFEPFAGSSYLLLDCCYAGRYGASRRGRRSGNPASLLAALEQHEGQLSKHSALMACPADTVTREPKDLGHGIFTHHLLRALAGEAAGSDGEVTFNDATKFVQKQRLQPPVGLFAHDWGPTTVLTRPALAGRASAPRPRRPPRTNVLPLTHPLDANTAAIETFLDRLFPASVENQSHQAPLELVHAALRADGAAIVELAPRPHILGLSGPLDPGSAQRLAISVSKNYDWRDNLGYQLVEEDGRQLLAIPLNFYNQENASLLIVASPESDAIESGEPLAAIIRAVINTKQTDAREAEIDVLTELRRIFGRMPLALYHRCFTLYQEALRSMVIAFEPIVTLSENYEDIGVHSYEALARRDTNTRRAPGRMLDVAQIWGDRFLIERDGTLATEAIRSYANAHLAGPWKRDRRKPFSINVAVRSLLSDVYAEIVRAAIADSRINPRDVTLEISERDEIRPKGPEENWSPDPHHFFRDRLLQLNERLEVNFAVDDFGVGHASLDRLSRLTLTQVKIDRAIIQHPPTIALEEIALVVRIAEHPLREGGAPSARDVVVEGVDGQALLSLAQIYRAGVRLVQGHINEMPASPRLCAPDDHLRRRLAAKVRGDRDEEL